MSCPTCTATMQATMVPTNGPSAVISYHCPRCGTMVETFPAESRVTVPDVVKRARVLLDKVEALQLTGDWTLTTAITSLREAVKGGE